MKKTLTLSIFVGVLVGFAILALLGFKPAHVSAPEASTAGKEFKIITTIESVVPMGLGRSRIIENLTDVDHSLMTTERGSGKVQGQRSARRGDIKIDDLAETKILNFYSGVGLNFQNIASNDAMITSKLNEMSDDGWELHSIVSGVESDAGKGDGNGIFITRFFFMRDKN